MTRSELIAALTERQTHLPPRDVDFAARTVLELLTETLMRGERIEIRGFGSFEVRRRPARMGRNPRTGAAVALPATRVPHFKPGAELRARLRQLSADVRLTEYSAGSQLILETSRRLGKSLDTFS